MTTITITAPAKINLSLSVGARRPDGYHDVHSVMQTISLCDTLTVMHTPDAPGILMEVSGPERDGVPTNSSNLVYKAAAALLGAVRYGGLRIDLAKRIPSQAGLGGGSSDAAATLIAVNQLLDLNLSLARLGEIAASLGADVPFFLIGGMALAEGLGERITPLPSQESWPIVIIKPHVGVSTAWAYAALDASPDRRVSEQPGNDFESVILPALPEVRAIYEMLLAAPERHPETLPLLCGSGSAVFCRARDNGLADTLAKHMEAAGVGKVWRSETRGARE